jgi:hypothetical protein
VWVVELILIQDRKNYNFDKMAHKNRVNLWTFKKGEMKSRIERR